VNINFEKMKKLFVLIALLSFYTCTLTSCGGKKEEVKNEENAEEEYSDEEIAQGEKPSSEELIKQGQALVDASDCKTCHHATNKIVGPSHTDVAKKYDFTQASITLLAGKIVQGGSGTWGDIPMTPHPDISFADAEKMAMYVLSLDGEKPND
jgi:cytochrome c